eukprot:COSAG05_NODE_4600_length_1443_cov_1.503720_1_plen_342_part_00
MRTALFALFGAGWLAVVSESQGTCSLTTAKGSVSLSALNSASGNIATTPLGNVRINPCQKVTLCDAMQTGSGCCVQVNDTSHPDTSRWISCGVTPVEANVGSGKGIVLTEGPGCGYVFSSSNQKVQASISFVCDQTATGPGRVSADTSAFLKAPSSSASAAPGGAPGGSKPAAVFDPNVFCNLNFTWHTNLVCGIMPENKSTSHNWGIVVILLLLGLGGAYFGGMHYGVIPKNNLMMEVPGMARDGINFITSGGKTASHFAQYASVPNASSGSGDVEKKKGGAAKKKPEKKTPANKKLADKKAAGNAKDAPAGKKAAAAAPEVSYSDQMSAAPRSIMPGAS